MTEPLQPAELDAILQRAIAEAAANPHLAYGPQGERCETLQKPSIPLSSLPTRTPLSFQPTASPPASGPCTLGLLLAYNDAAFVQWAYRALLGREPDPSGYLHLLTELRNGAAKVDLLGRLRFSPEGRALGREVPGLGRAWLIQRVYRLPLFGRLVQIVSALWHLPDIERSLRAQECQNIARAEQTEAYRQSRDDEACIQLNISIMAVHELQGLVTKVLDLIALKSDKLATAHLSAAVLALDSTLESARADLEAQMCSKLESRPTREELDAAQARIAALGEALESSRSELAAKMTSHLDSRPTREELDAAQARIAALGDALESARSELAAQMISHLDSRPTREELDAAQARIDGLENAVEQVGGDLVTASSLSQEVTSELRASLAEQLSNKAEVSAFNTLAEGAAERADSFASKLSDLRLNVLDQERRLRLLLEEARKRLPEPISTEQIENMVEEELHLLDAFYVAFEDQFRGTRQDVKGRVSVYLPHVREALERTVGAPILDLGCGRGEWLELLKENGFTATGLDLNRVMISQCRESGLEVVEGDAIEYLRAQPSNSLGVITGFHIIEHIPFTRLITLFDEALRVIRPGGLIIFETPNPENILVGSCNFYFDPTHLNPLPPEMVRFVVEARGFVDPEILRLHPHPVPENADLTNPLIQRMAWAQDYAVIARKA